MTSLNFTAPVVNNGNTHFGDIHNYAPHTKSLGKIITVDSAPFPSAYFTGREKELADIKKNIAENKKLMLVNGMGGIGKSELCKKLFHEYNDTTDGKINHIGWIVFDENLKKTLYGKFKETIKITDSEGNFIYTKIHINELSNELLLFIDNMNEVSEEDEILLNQLACNIIITSRCDNIGNIKPVKIGELSQEDCIFIYKEILNRNSYQDEIVNKIVEKAARLTLVVELLAKTANEAMLSDDELLANLNANGFDLSNINEKINKKTFNEHMMTLFDLSKINKSELEVLKKFSLFSPMSLPSEVTKKWLEMENLNPLNDLVKKGWLIKTDTGFYMHHVISDVVKYENKPTYGECADLVKIIADDLSFRPMEIFTSRLWILPFGEKILEYFKNVENENVTYLIDNTARLYRLQGAYTKALEYYDNALKIRNKILGKGHIDIATTYNDMADVFQNQSDYDKALEYYGKAFEIREKVLDKKHPDIATIYNNMGLVFSKQGDYDKALGYYWKALEIREKVFGKKHIDTAIVYNNIGIVFRHQYVQDKALEYYEKVLKIREKVLGKEHPDTAYTYNYIATVFYDQKCYDKALEYYWKALEIREKVLGKKHQSTATTYNNMGLVFLDQGDYGKAFKYCEKALEIREKILGKEHPSTAVTYNNRAKVFEAQGNYDKALEWYIKSYRILLKKLVPKHLIILRVYENMKGAYKSSNKNMDFENWLQDQLSKLNKQEEAPV